MPASARLLTIGIISAMTMTQLCPLSLASQAAGPHSESHHPATSSTSPLPSSAEGPALSDGESSEPQDENLAVEFGNQDPGRTHNGHPLPEPSRREGAAKAHTMADTEEKSPPPKTETYPALEQEAPPEGAFGQAGKNSNGLHQIEAFDPVPSPQREPVIRRLYLVEKLIREHGRAYDYRTITYAELLSILNQLRKEKAAKAKIR